MRYIVVILFFSFVSLYSKGVSAGTIIQNSATLTYSMQHDTYSIKSNIARSIVAQLIDVKVSWMDTRAVNVTLGDKKRVLTYKVLNSGNAKDSFLLSIDELKYKSDFSLAKTEIFLDTNENYHFDSFDKNMKVVNLDEDREQIVFVVADISDFAKVKNGSQNFVLLKARSQTGGSGKRGKVYEKKGIKGVDVVDGLSGGVDEDEGSYKFLISNLILDKDVSIDKDGLITVKIDVFVRGEGGVKNVNIVDDIPNETQFINGSLRFDGSFLSDQRDGDIGSYKKKFKKEKAKIVVNLGELDSSSFHTISYNLKII